VLQINVACAGVEKPVPLTTLRRIKVTIPGRNQIFVVNPFMIIPIGPAKCGQHSRLFQNFSRISSEILRVNGDYNLSLIPIGKSRDEIGELMGHFTSQVTEHLSVEAGYG
jgi:hypothetical protein